MYGCLDTSSRSAPQTSPVITFMIPRAEITSFHSNEMRSMPTVPLKMPKNPVRDEAEPVPACCCRYRFQMALQIMSSG